GRSGPAPSPRAARGRPTSAQRLPPADSTLRTPASSAIGANGSERGLPLSPGVGVGSGAFVHEPAPTRRPPSRTNASSASASRRSTDGGSRMTAVSVERRAASAGLIRSRTTWWPALSSSAAYAASPSGPVAYDDEVGPPGVPPEIARSPASRRLSAATAVASESAIFQLRL